MKKTFLPYLFLSVLLLAGLSFSCSERWQNSDAAISERADFTLAEAKRAFETTYAAMPSTRAEGEFDEDRILDPYGIDPVWESVSFCYGDSLLLADVPFAACYDYRLLRWDEDGVPMLAPLPNWLVVVKDSNVGATSSWLFFLIPDANTGSDFSGTALFTTLSGQPVSVGKFVCGTLVAEASLYDDTRSVEENVGLLAELLPDIYVARLRKQPLTRGTKGKNKEDTAAIGNHYGIVPVEIVGQAPVKVPGTNAGSGPTGSAIYIEPIFPDVHGGPKPPSIMTMNHLFRGSEGRPTGDDGDSDDGEIPYPNNPHIEADEETRMILDSIYMDCMGQILVNAINTRVPIVREPDRTGCTLISITDTYSSGRQEISHRILAGPGVTSIALMEELMHIYQGAGTPAFNEAKLNKEIEAKLTWYIYMMKNDIRMPAEKYLGGVNGDMCFYNMHECILSNDWEKPAFSWFYESAAESLRSMRAYRSEPNYPFDPDNMDISCLLKLLQDCLK